MAANAESGGLDTERIVKKYPNRRLYDTAISKYITLEDVRDLVTAGVKFRVVDARTEEDITRNILLQLILELEEKGQPIFSKEVLEQIVRTYGDAMQGFMAIYIKQSLDVFLTQQKLMQEQMANLVQTGPAAVFADLARENLKLWQTMQESFLKVYSPDSPKKGKDDDSPSG